MKDLPSRWYYIALLVWLVIVVMLFYVANPKVAAYVLAASCAVIAGLRIFTSSRVIPHVRATWFDVLTLLGFAVLLWYLAKWGMSARL